MPEPQESIDCHDLRNIQYKTMLMNGKKLYSNTNNEEINFFNLNKKIMPKII